MKNVKPLVLLGIVFAACIATYSVFAQSQVIIGSTIYTCPNACVVTVTPNGGTMVTDSRGGRIKQERLTRPQ